VARGGTSPHFRKVLLGRATQAPFLHHLDRRITKNQTENQCPPHDETLIGLITSDNRRLFQGIFAPKENGFATVPKLLHGLVPMK
jgi:hypothetical protein